MILQQLKEQGAKLPAPIVPQWNSYSGLLPQEHPLMADPIERLTVAVEQDLMKLSVKP